MARRSFLLTFFTSVLPWFASAQQELSWRDLAQVTWEEKFIEEYNMNFLVPVFGSIREKEGETISIKGYVLPLDAEGNFFVLSRFPYSSCFFCGGAGPESIVELILSDREKRKFEMDDLLIFEGTLRLNGDDLNHFTYMLEDAKVVHN